PVALPPRWWGTDLTFRQSTIEPRVYFGSRPLNEAEKRGCGVPTDGFASEGTRVGELLKMVKSHELRPADLIVSVVGVERDELADAAEIVIKLRKKAGDSVMLDVLREGKRMQRPLKAYRMSFRN